jgi:hypothetical protein
MMFAEVLKLTFRACSVDGIEQPLQTADLKILVIKELVYYTLIFTRYLN